MSERIFKAISKNSTNQNIRYFSFTSGLTGLASRLLHVDLLVQYLVGSQPRISDDQISFLKKSMRLDPSKWCGSCMETFSYYMGFVN